MNENIKKKIRLLGGMAAGLAALLAVSAGNPQPARTAEIAAGAESSIDNDNQTLSGEEIAAAADISDTAELSDSAEPAQTLPIDRHLYYDYQYSRPVSGPAILYGNGAASTAGDAANDSRMLTIYTNIRPSYLYKDNGKGKIKASVGKVIAGLTVSNTEPEIKNNRITDSSAAKIAKVSIRNGQVTVTSTGKAGGMVYLWIIDTGQKKVKTSFPIDVRLTPTKLEIQDTSGGKLQNTELKKDTTLQINVAGFVGSTKTDASAYTVTAEVDSRCQNYVTVTPAQNRQEGSDSQFIITATGLYNNSSTKVFITFKCSQNGKTVTFPLTIMPAEE